jgi:hypothetical protein
LSLFGCVRRHDRPTDRWVPSMRLAPEGEFSNFVEGLGPGQIVGRQALASHHLGDIQLSLCDRKGNLEVEVVRARGLQAKQGAKLLPGDHPFPTHHYHHTPIPTHPNIANEMSVHSYVSALCQSISREREEMHRKGQDGHRSQDSRPTLSATAALHRRLPGLYSTGLSHLSIQSLSLSNPTHHSLIHTKKLLQILA